MKKEHMEVILEDMNSKFDIIIEGHQSLHGKIDSVRTELKEDMKGLDAKIDFVHRSLSKKIDQVDLKIDDVESNLKGEIREVKDEIRVIGDRLDDHEDMIEKRA